MLFPRELERVGLTLAPADGRRVLLYERHVRRFPSWRGRVGEYALVEPVGEVAEWAGQERIRLIEQDGFLLAVTEQAGDIESVLVIRPVDDTRAVVAGIGSAKGQSLAVEERDGEVWVRYSGMLLRRTGPVSGGEL